MPNHSSIETNFGKVALDATLHCHKWSAHPLEAWKIAAEAAFPDQPSMPKKSCPKNAFLGLCEEGCVIGVPKGTYTKSKKNKAYALAALRLLSAERSLSMTATDLWRLIPDAGSLQHNDQMHVVLALWERGMLRRLR